MRKQNNSNEVWRNAIYNGSGLVCSERPNLRQWKIEEISASLSYFTAIFEYHIVTIIFVYQGIIVNLPKTKLFLRQNTYYI